MERGIARTRVSAWPKSNPSPDSIVVGTQASIHVRMCHPTRSARPSTRSQAMNQAALLRLGPVDLERCSPMCIEGIQDDADFLCLGAVNVDRPFPKMLQRAVDVEVFLNCLPGLRSNSMRSHCQRFQPSKVRAWDWCRDRDRCDRDRCQSVGGNTPRIWCADMVPVGGWNGTGIWCQSLGGTERECQSLGGTLGTLEWSAWVECQSLGGTLKV